MELIAGKQIGSEIRHSLKEEIKKFRFCRPGLAFILVGEDPASQTYVRMKQQGCREVGIFSKILEFPSTVTNQELIDAISNLNHSDEIDGILVQQPLPAHICLKQMIEVIDPQKDVDGFHPLNLGKLLMGDEEGFIPCTPAGILYLLRHYKIPIQGKKVVVIGRSNIVGKPLAVLFMQKRYNATVTLCHSYTENLQEITQTGDIIVVATGQPHMLTGNMIKKGAVVIDVGINRGEGKKLTGDVDFDDVKHKVSWITPVPGGVGPMTIAMLLQNTVQSFKRRMAMRGICFVQDSTD